MYDKTLIDQLNVAGEDSRLSRFGRGSLKTAFFITKWKPVLGITLNILIFTAFSALSTFAQGSPNPWGGSGTTRLANAGSNILVIATWLALFVGILSIVLIPLFIKMEWNYQKLIFSALTGLGGFAVIGSIAYDIVNLNSIDMADPTIGR